MPTACSLLSEFGRSITTMPFHAWGRKTCLRRASPCLSSRSKRRSRRPPSSALCALRFPKARFSTTRSMPWERPASSCRGLAQSGSQAGRSRRRGRLREPSSPHRRPRVRRFRRRRLRHMRSRFLDRSGNLDLVQMADLGYGRCRFVVAEPRTAKGKAQARYASHLGAFV